MLFRSGGWFCIFLVFLFSFLFSFSCFFLGVFGDRGVGEELMLCGVVLLFDGGGGILSF